jgi:non-specific serine/threonine protein kinase/serine/threonine-protein kinase
LVPRLGPDHPFTLTILDSLAGMYRAFGRTAEAIPLAERVRDVRVMTLGSYHPYTIHTLENLALAYQSAGQRDKALSTFQQAAAGLEKLEFVHAEAGLIVGSLCDCLEDRERFDEADAWRRKWLSVAKQRDGPDSAAYAEKLANQAEKMLRHKRHKSAEPILRECVAIGEKKGPGAWTTFHARSLLGDCLLGQEKYALAEPLLLQAYEGLKARKEQIPRLYSRQRIAEAGQRIIRLYETWGRPEKATEWRSNLTEASAAMPHP